MEHFNVLDKIGNGTYGTVYVCERKYNKQKIVVKTIVVDSDKEQLEAAKNEVTILKSLKHPNIIQYYDHFFKHGCFYMVMEHATQGTLYDLINGIKPNYFCVNKVMSYFSQILMAVNHIHQKKIIHRDLKSENVFLTGFNKDVVKIGDFGISKAVKIDSGKTQTVIGTTNYVAPEILDGKPYDFKSDIWSIGCVLFEICARQRMFEGSMSEVIMNIKNGNKKRISTEMYGLEIQSLIDCTLNANPDERPTAEELMGFPQVFPHMHKVMFNLGNIAV